MNNAFPFSNCNYLQGNFDQFNELEKTMLGEEQGKKEIRTGKRKHYTKEQIYILELEFNNNNYPKRLRRYELSIILNITEKQVKTWFQNRRMKNKRSASSQ